MANCGDDFGNQLTNGLEAALIGLVIGGSIYLVKEMTKGARKSSGRTAEEREEAAEKRAAKGKK